MDDTSNIFHIINNFNLFLRIVENKQWARRATAEVIKNTFKLASFIEKVTWNLKNKKILDKFIEVFKNWLQENEGRNLSCDVNIFEYASDYVLEILLCYQTATLDSADIALRIYTTLNSIERLQVFLKEKILNHSSYNALLDIVVNSSNDPKNTEAYMILKEWKKLINEGGSHYVRESISEMLSNYRLAKSLHVLLKMCVLPEIDTEFQNIKLMILEKLREKFLDKSALSKEFWNYLFKKLDTSVLVEVCFHNTEIINLLFNFIEYIAAMMSITHVNSQKTWVANKQFSLCPEITYNDLFKIIKELYCKNDEMKNLIATKIRDAHKNSLSELWDDILFSL